MKIQAKSALTASLLALIAAQPSAAEDLTIKFSAFVGERNPIFACSMIPLVEELEANQGTKVEVERYFGGGAFGNPVQQYDQALRGISDISFGMLTYTEGLFPLTEIVSMPFVMNNHEEATRVLNEVILPEYLGEELDEVKIINLWLTSPYQFHMREAVADLTALNGTRMRVVGQVQVPAMEALGAQVAAFPAPATYENLQKGVIDGTVATWTTATAFKVGEVAKQHYELNFGGSVGFTAMNLDSYNALPDDVKAIIDAHSGPAASMKVAKCFTAVDAKAKAKWTEAGNTTHVVPEETRMKMKEVIAPVIEGHLKMLDEKGLPATEVRNRIDAELAKSN
ncbi:TRAP transporter substrate-binding protein [Pseudooceanicola nitratireducens]|uniref:TRAP transporter substrate-binding protein n=1 Tax=Pseudooceanicola nitratireducens TaxID=517719 RepID=UPI001C94439A|nr:TRAP transporter substrate-binding protein [Pseudooceanicola nitratireducens]MBY6158890.1 TRAP transporter substrate-binding protein [Pseudooceanicola nitratireducens]